MDAIVLAAGYGTRLHPLTENKQKPLLEVAGKPIIEHIIAKLNEIETIKKIYIITNDKFEENFNEWLHGFDAKKPIEIINDKTKNNDERLVAIGDIDFTIKNKNIDDDNIVVAGDNHFDISLKEVANMFHKKKNNTIV